MDYRFLPSHRFRMIEETVCFVFTWRLTRFATAIHAVSVSLIKLDVIPAMSECLNVDVI